MDRPATPSRLSFARWPIAARLGLAAGAVIFASLAGLRLIAGGGESTLRIPADQLTLAAVEQGIFHDLIPLRARVEPRETVMIDAADGGRVDRVMVEAGDRVQAGQPLLELSNTNLALSVIQQESQLNQAMSVLQQNEIALEQNALANSRALAEIEYHLVKLERSALRRASLVAGGGASKEQHDEIADELAYYRSLLPIQAASSQRQSALRDRLLPHIHRQLASLSANLEVVQSKLGGLIVRAPVDGVVTAMDLKVGEHRAAGDRLAEVTPESGMKLVADVDEYYLSRLRAGQMATVDFDGEAASATVRRVSPQVRNGQVSIDLAFEGDGPASLVSGETAQGRLQLGDDTPARVLPAGAFLERTGGNWVFVLSEDGNSARRRDVRVGRRTAEQLEILDGLAPGDRVVVSDYTGFDRVDRILLTD